MSLWVFRGGTEKPSLNEIGTAVAKRAPLLDDDDGRLPNGESKMEIGRRNERRDIQSTYKCIIVRDFNDPLKMCTGLNHHVVSIR
jgi:hypothetical protein